MTAQFKLSAVQAAAADSVADAMIAIDLGTDQNTDLGVAGLRRAFGDEPKPSDDLYDAVSKRAKARYVAQIAVKYSAAKYAEKTDAEKKAMAERAAATAFHRMYKLAGYDPRRERTARAGGNVAAAAVEAVAAAMPTGKAMTSKDAATMIRALVNALASKKDKAAAQVAADSAALIALANQAGSLVAMAQHAEMLASMFAAVAATVAEREAEEAKLRAAVDARIAEMQANGSLLGAAILQATADKVAPKAKRGKRAA